VKPAATSSSSTHRPARKSPRPASPASPVAGREQPSKPKSSRSFGRQTTGSSSATSYRKKHDLDTHPLNLHPDEYKRLSALSAMSDRSSFDKMDVDREPSAAPPSSPPADQPSQSGPQITIPISPPTNGNKSPVNGEGPTPPPHKSNPSSPVPSAADEAEAYKAAGNKFFKDKDYKNAIVQYTKGMFSIRSHACKPSWASLLTLLDS
jgi:DnaJ family protein C protein 7